MNIPFSWLSRLRFSSPKTMRLLLVLGLVLLNSLVVLTIALTLWSSRQQQERQVETLTQNFSLMLDQSISAAIRQWDISLLAIGDELERQLRQQGRLDSSAVNALLARYSERHHDSAAIRITDDEGWVRYGPGVTPSTTSSYADRPFFQRHRRDAESGLIVTSPIMGRVSGQWVVAMTRRYNDAQGRFAGVISAAVPVNYFQTLLSGLDLGIHGSALLRDQDGALVTRYPPVTGMAGQVGNRVYSQEFARLIAQKTPSATYHSSATSDKVERTNTFRRLEMAPFYLVTGLASEDYLDSWYDQAYVATAFVLVFILSTSVASWRAWRLYVSAQQEAERNRVFLKHASDGVHILNKDGDVLEVSDAFCEALGYSREEVEKMNVRDWDVQYLPSELRAMIHSLFLKNSVSRFESLHRRRDGQVLNVEISTYPFTLADQAFLFASSRDITERKRAEAALKESETRFKALFDNSPDPCFIIDAQHRFTLCNASAVQILGYERAEQVLRQPPSALSPVYQADGRTSLEKSEECMDIAHRQGIHRFEWQHLRHDGSMLPVEVTLASITLNGEACLYCMWRDISARKQAEDRLLKLSMAVEQSPESIVITDVHGHIEYVNEAFVRNTGYQREEALGQNPRILQSGRTPKSVYTELWHALRQGQVWQGEFVNRRKDESEYIEFAIVSPIRQANGQISHYVAIKQDITNQKDTEAELLQYRQHLEDLVEQRTAQLAEAKQIAETASRAKSAFLANMSHEIRTPMNGILGMAHLLQREALTPTQTERVARISEAGQHLLNVINDILDLSKIEAEKFVLEESDISVPALVHNAISMLQERASSKGLQLAAEIDDIPGHLLGDPTRLQQALLNYGTNAIKFTEQGSITLAVRVLQDHPEYALLHFEVRDTGIGIAPDVIPRLFSAFEQADNSTTRRYGGTGLGLSITRRLAQLMGGSSGVNSHLGQGSCFWFTACLKKSQTSPAHVLDQAPAQPHVLLAQHFPGLRILMAEDEPINQEVSLEYLKDIGFQCDVVQNGAQAVAAAQNHAYPLILMDMQMPDMDGLEATRRIRAAGHTMPILALTANAFAEDKARCLEAGMNDMIVKPISPPDFYGRIWHWLHQH